MNKIVKDALVLMAFSLVLGFVLGGVYKITEPIIAEAMLKKELEAYKVVFENADTFNLKDVDATLAGTVQSSYSVTIDKVLEAVDANGTNIGYVVQLTAKGYGGGIVMIVGVQLDGALGGVSVTSQQESPGFGADLLSDPSYLGQFKGVVGSEAGNVAMVSGVTVTTTAVRNGINAAVDYATALVGGAQ
jgi:electron transport complex protein RnfG